MVLKTIQIELSLLNIFLSLSYWSISRWMYVDLPNQRECRPWRNLEIIALSSLHKLLRNRLVGGGGVFIATSPFHTHSLAINAKSTVHCSPDSSMMPTLVERLIHRQISSGFPFLVFSFSTIYFLILRTCTIIVIWSVNWRKKKNWTNTVGARLCRLKPTCPRAGIGIFK